MRVGVVGPGRIGQMHARHAAQHPAVEEVVLVGRSSERVAVAAEAVRSTLVGRPDPLNGAERPAHLTGTTDLAHTLAEVDGVVIATATPTHPELVRQAVAAGTPVLVEKPLALDVRELAALTTELESQPVPVMVGYQRRYDPAYQALRRHVQAGNLGDVRLVRATSHDHHAVPAAYLPTSGGIWRDLVVHDLDVMPWVIGEPVVRIQATGAVLEDRVYAQHGDVDTALVQLTFASGAFGTISALRRTGAGHDVRLEVFGTGDTYAAGIDDHTPVTSTEAGARTPVEVHEDFIARFATAFRTEIDHFVRLVGGEAGANLTPPGAGLGAQRLAEAARESARTGRAFEVPIEP